MQEVYITVVENTMHRTYTTDSFSNRGFDAHHSVEIDVIDEGLIGNLVPNHCGSQFPEFIWLVSRCVLAPSCNSHSFTRLRF